MRHLRVLVVDDSAYNRRTISELLCTLPAVSVVGKASDGDEALRMMAELQPDLITLDLEMPRMDGFTFLRLMMARCPTPVIVVSGYSAKENVFRALEMGALDFVAKPTRTVTSDLSGIGAELAEKVEVVRQLSPAGLELGARLRGSSDILGAPRRTNMGEREPARVIVIGSSTGGPTALVEIFRRLPASTSTAIVVAQHMPERFTKTFAERLDKLGGMRVVEASEVHALSAGAAFICPGGRCVELVSLQRGPGIKVVPPDAGDRYVPSADRLFESAARVFGPSTVGVVLTGMGDDGAKGALALRDAGGVVLAESAESAVIYGMPGAAVRTGAVERSLPLRAMAERLAELSGG